MFSCSSTPNKGNMPPLMAAKPSINSKAAEVVWSFIEAINRHDVVEISALMTRDHSFIDPAGRLVTGRDAMIEGWTGYFRMFPDYKILIEQIVADGSVVAAFGSASGTFNGKRGLVPANKIEMPAAWKAVVESCQIKIWQVYADWTTGVKIMEEDQKAS
jgi:ketosteroid isomerase-like protein